MLNSQPIARDAGGRLSNLPIASFPSPYFNGGTPLSILQELVTATGAPTRFVGGMGYLDSGALCIDGAGAIAGYTPGGLPVTAAGLLCVSVNQAVATWNAGIPLGAGGRVSLATASGFLNLHGFDSGFDQTAFN